MHFLDTNVYIIGAIEAVSYEREILNWLGWEGKISESELVEVVVSEEVFEQILRVAKRLRNKDWGGDLLSRLWTNFNLCYVILDDHEYTQILNTGIIPREDIGVYLTAQGGNAQCFVSSNHKLIRALVTETGEFECLTPEEFVNQYF